MKKSMEEWKSWGKERQIQLYFYQQKVLDLTTFSRLHPGGKKALKNYVYKDITQILFHIYPHRPQILHTLAKYNIGTNISFGREGKMGVRSKSKKKEVGSSRQKKKVCFRKTIYYTQDQAYNQAQNITQHKDIDFKQIKQQASSNEGKGKFESMIKTVSDSSYNYVKINSVDWLDEQKQECNHAQDTEEIQECMTGIRIPYLPVKTMTSISL